MKSSWRKLRRKFGVPQTLYRDLSEANTTLSKLKNKSSFLVTPWTNYYTNLIPEHAEDRLVVFKPPETSQYFGCIRVKDNTRTIWDVINKEGQYIGRVPAGCRFEAMVVDVKIITPK